AALAAYCQSYAKWKAADEVVKAQGLTYELYDEAGNVRCVMQRPEIGISNQCLKQIKTFCSVFGMEPSARAKIELPNSQQSNADAEFIAKIRGAR
ncbi:MAG: phage terminase small subunit P27 family, partial [Clostridia bacterium]|nr:phage terminase small subunit P27 family [Clostridia bacterium]